MGTEAQPQDGLVYCDRVDIWDADGSKHHCYFSPKADPLPLGKFSTERLPEDVRAALGHLGKSGIRFEVRRVKIQGHGLFRGI